MRSFRLVFTRSLAFVTLLCLLFTFSAPMAFASTGGSNTGGSGEKDYSHPSATIQNPHAKSSTLTPDDAGGCNILLSSSKSGTIMTGWLNVTCLGGIAYWIYNVTYSEHCVASIAGYCWAGWDSTNTLPECSIHNSATLNCGPYQREGASGQLWRWRADTCIQFLPSDVSQCAEETSQVQF